MRPWLGNDNLVQRFYKPHLKVISRRHSPSGFAWEEDLYRLQLPNAENPVEVEQTIGRIEDVALPIRDKILREGVEKLSTLERAQFSLFLALLLVRRPEYVRPKIEPAQQDWEEKMLTMFADPIAKNKITEDAVRTLCEGFGSALVLGGMMDSAKKWAGKIAALDWRSFDLSSGNLTTLLSDNPIRMWGDGEQDLKKITIPLSPHCVFVGGAAQSWTEVRYRDEFRNILALDFIGDQFRSARYFVIGLDNGPNDVLLDLANQNWGKDVNARNAMN